VEALFDYLHRVMINNEWWEVIIELLLIGLVVYWVVDFLEGTRGERLFRGVIFILVAGAIISNQVVDRFSLSHVAFLYNGFLIGVLIIAVAGFQPEIRRVLIRVGQPRLWHGGAQELSKTIEEIVAAATDLSATRTGAIVVLERHVALGEFVETGVRLEARVTAELLKTIFYPGTSLHDMAAVIRNDRIVAARVQLPLAEAGSVRLATEGNPIGSKGGAELGSRHRAAIGISTGSDAVCVVVSEETGAISIAREGKLNRNITECQLRSHLVDTLANDASAMMTKKRYKKAKKKTPKS
jgi:diadenylate cyclase